MITPVNQDLTGLALETHRARMDLEDSISKLSSGKRLQDAKADAGGFQQAAKLLSRNKRDHAAMSSGPRGKPKGCMDTTITLPVRSGACRGPATSRSQSAPP